MIRTALIAALALGQPAPAQPPANEPQARACPTIGELAAIALRRDPRIGEADALRRKSEAEVRIARGAYLPQLSAFNRIGVGDGAVADNQLDNRAGLRLSQQVFDFGQTDLARRVANARLAQAGSSAEGARLNVLVEVVQRQLGLLRARERAAAADEMSSFYARGAQQSQVELEVGLLKRSEAAAIRAEAARTAAMHAEEELRAAQERTALDTLVGMDTGCLDLAATAAYLRVAQPADLPAAIDAALMNAPDLKAREAAAAAADLEHRRERASHRPSLSISGTSAYDYGFADTPSRQVNRIGLDLATPLFQGGQLSGRSEARAAEASASQFALATARRELIEAVTITWHRIAGLHGIAALQDTTLASAREQSGAVEEEFKAQLVTMSELIEAKRSEHQARLVEIDTRYQWHLEQLNLLKLTSGAPD